MILTTKHHDGFALWPTKSNYSKGWNAGEVGPKRDLVGDLTEAIREKGLKMGLYYSLLEFETHPNTGNDKRYDQQIAPVWDAKTQVPYIDKKYVDKYKIDKQDYISKHMIPQMKELVLKYKPAILYPDGEWEATTDYWHSKEFLAWLYNNAPNKDEIVVNDRWGWEGDKMTRGIHGGYYSREYFGSEELFDAKHPWEEIQGMGLSFGYNRGETIDTYRSSAALVHLLVSTVGRGGNLCLNVGPTADGRIPVIMQQRLIDIGDWLAINGDAIYGTQAWAQTEADKKVNENFGNSLFITKKGNAAYVITTEWPSAPIVLNGMNVSSPKVTMLGVEGAVKTTKKGAVLTLQAPEVSPAKVKGKYAYVFKIEGLK